MNAKQKAALQEQIAEIKLAIQRRKEAKQAIGDLQELLQDLRQELLEFVAKEVSGANG